MNKKTIIFVAGPAGVGKNTFADELVKQIYPDTRVGFEAFADPIKHVAEAYFGWDRQDKVGLGRTLLTDLGRAGRKFDPDIWGLQCAKRLDDSSLEVLIVTDLRYDNELATVKDYFQLYTDYEVDLYVIALHREFSSNLSTKQIADSSERGVSDDIIDIKIEMTSNKTISVPDLKILTRRLK